MKIHYPSPCTKCLTMLLLLLLILGSPARGWAQARFQNNNFTRKPGIDPSKDSSRAEHCGTGTAVQQLLHDDPEIANRLEEMEKTLAGDEDIIMSNDAAKGDPPTYVIPVVFHILESTLPGNPAANLITDAQIREQLAVLNQDFSATNLDLKLMQESGTGYETRVGSARIQFCLATRDATGNPTTGIDRRRAARSSYLFDPADTDDLQNPSNIPALHFLNPRHEAPAAPRWPTGRYLNIWVCATETIDPPGSGAILGFASFPNLYLDPANDGIVLHTSVFGIRSSTRPTLWNYRKGRVLTHEVGHWLFLRHTWGDDINKCPGDAANPNIPRDPPGADDFVADTPPQASHSSSDYQSATAQQLANNQCPFDWQPTLWVRSCGNGNGGGDMYMNFMDYTCERCQYMFTNGQVYRMRATLTTFRPGLLNTLALAPTQAVIAYALPTLLLCPDDRTSFRPWPQLPDGPQCVGSLSYAWTVPSGWGIDNPAAYSPTITPNGTAVGSVGLTITYTNGTASLNIVATPLAFTFNSTAPAAPVFATTGDVCLGATRTFAVQPVAGATGYTWQVPTGFTIQGPATGASVVVLAPALNSSLPQNTPYAISVSAALPTGCPTRAATTSFWLGTGAASIALSGAVSNGTNNEICANRNTLATVTLARNQGTNTNFQWRRRLLSGVLSGCLDTPPFGQVFYTYEPLANYPPNQMVIYTGITNSEVELSVTFDNSCGGPKAATFRYINRASMSGISCPPDVYCRPAPVVGPAPFPNPTATGLITVERLVGPVQVYNGQGRVVLNATAETEAAIMLDLRLLPLGLYQVVGHDKAGRIVRHYVQFNR